MSVELYYTAPSDAVFDEIKREALTLWREVAAGPYDALYLAEKLARVEPITNAADNWMHMVAMFDLRNQSTLLTRLRPATAALITEAMQ